MLERCQHMVARLLTSRLLPRPCPAPAAVRTGGQRRGVVSWNSEAVTDPRSGKLVYRVDPGTFCTQCFATHTPVWRAGPFGELCLARCGPTCQPSPLSAQPACGAA